MRLSMDSLLDLHTIRNVSQAETNLAAGRNTDPPLAADPKKLVAQLIHLCHVLTDNLSTGRVGQRGDEAL